ncbi:MAG TPA: type IV toxin-antitoxin system AbiEi family antitoxin [Acidimicrobiales bacterium]|nr:type IV toxin-antitoxin system AbiEi family antitoxin [Acidimicrobiales bacterium]
MPYRAPVTTRRAAPGRRIPGALAALLATLARNRPQVVTRRDLEALIDEHGWDLDAERTARQLQRLGWFAPVHLKGVWAFLPAGEDDVTDPYIDLRGWRAREPEAAFALAGEAAAWHLGYLGRRFDGPVVVWVPTQERLPYGLRAHLSVVTLGWRAEDAPRLGPTPASLLRRHLDLTDWAGGLPAFGPEALVVQLAARPASFAPWADLVAHLDQLARDVDVDRLAGLLTPQSTSAWQRASYLLDQGGRRDDAMSLLERRPVEAMPKIQFGTGRSGVWAPEFRLTDRLIAPLRDSAAKA